MIGNKVMESVLQALGSVLKEYSFLTALALVGVLLSISYAAAQKLTRGRLHGSAVAIFIALVFAGLAGIFTGGKKGVADFECLAGLAVLGGSAFRDFTIVATAYGVSLERFWKTGFAGVLSLLAGVFVSFAVGAAVAWGFGYRDPISLTTIGAGAATYIVGPVTGAAIGASSDVMAISIAAGLVKAILVMVATPLLAPLIGLNNPRTALIFGGLLGTTSGVAAGLAATDERLVPYGAMTATFYTGLGCLLGPSVFYIVVRSIFT
jgi:malonate transporter MadM subunit